ncbi:GPP34 family phosphoprotein [Streptomyces caatingaensis]|uniref:GPP34 family phosphoprotein n=1 Tax=Streptomyces caatingaensis TaxID=1678637 RepID=A0A0K9XAR2_9ACTN|nr:GPP34 family phosphoprotein [Streptomyces caatingaensis]KNB50514.1 hypothetical protein AC230_21390 [Streptomyces caatingaensis]
MTAAAHGRSSMAEDLMLLALEPGSGRVRGRLRTRYALAAAELMERELTGSVRPEADGRRVAVTGSSGTAGRALTRRWLARHARGGAIARYGDHLAARGLVRARRRRLAGVLPVTRYPLLGHDAVAELRSRIEAAAQGDADATADLRALRLGALLAAVGLDGPVFPGPAFRGLRRRLAERAAADWAAREARRALRAAMAAASGGG